MYLRLMILSHCCHPACLCGDFPVQALQSPTTCRLRRLHFPSHTHEIPRLDADEKAEVYYSRSDYKKFLIAYQRFHADRQKVAKQEERRKKKDAWAILKARTQELGVDDLRRLNKPPIMPVRQTSSRNLKVSDVSTFNDSFSKLPPSMPVRQVSSSSIAVTDLSSPAVALSEPCSIPEQQVASITRMIVVADMRPASVQVSEPPPPRPVRNDSKLNISDMAMDADVALPDSFGSQLDLLRDHIIFSM
jgi:hypothetical protein